MTRVRIGLFFKSNRKKLSSPSPVGDRCATSVWQCYPQWVDMADSQVEHFTAPQTSGELTAADQQSEEAM